MRDIESRQGSCRRGDNACGYSRPRCPGRPAGISLQRLLSELFALALDQQIPNLMDIPNIQDLALKLLQARQPLKENISLPRSFCPLICEIFFWIDRIGHPQFSAAALDTGLHLGKHAL